MQSEKLSLREGNSEKCKVKSDESANALMCDSLVKNEKCKVKSRWAGSAYLFFGGEKTKRDGEVAASPSRESALLFLFFLLEETLEGGGF